MSAPANSMIEIRGVTKRFGSFTAVNDISLSVREGEFITLLGPSGCGKTTLLRLLAGFETPDAGSILLAGEDVSHLPPYRRSVNQVFQSYALFPHLTVRENVGFGLRMQQVPAAAAAERIREALATVSLEPMADRFPHQLSGGQRQRVALARAIVCRPKVLLLDEPLSALDAKLRHAMQLELKHLQRQLGLTFVFVTHDQEEAFRLADRVAIFAKGRKVQEGPPREVYRRPLLVVPPLFCRGPRLSWALVTVVAPVRVPIVIKLLVDVTGWLPEKSPPLVLLAMMVLAMLRVPVLAMPPPWLAEFPDTVELVTVTVPPLLAMPPPWPAEFPDTVELEKLRIPPPSLNTPPPKIAVLSKRVELVKATVPVLAMPPPWLAEFPDTVELVTITVPPLLAMAPPWPAEFPDTVELEKLRIPLPAL